MTTWERWQTHLLSVCLVSGLPGIGWLRPGFWVGSKPVHVSLRGWARRRYLGSAAHATTVVACLLRVLAAAACYPAPPLRRPSCSRCRRCPRPLVCSHCPNAEPQLVCLVCQIWWNERNTDMRGMFPSGWFQSSWTMNPKLKHSRFWVQSIPTHHPNTCIRASLSNPFQPII